MIESNPFSTRFVRPGAIPFHFGHRDERERIVGDLMRHRMGLIVGPHGSGKTTLLHELRPLLSGSFPDITHWQLAAPLSRNSFSRKLVVRWKHGQRACQALRQAQRALPEDGLLIVDGAEQIGRWQWSRLLRSTRRRRQCVLATSHQPRDGMAILYRTAPTTMLVHVLTKELLASAPLHVAGLVHSELNRRDLSKLTNLRDLWFELYDVVQPYAR